MNKAKAAVPEGCRGQAALLRGPADQPMVQRTISSTNTPSARHRTIHENRKTAHRKKAAAPKPQKAKPQAPSRSYYWPTPNGHKISIMLEELKLPL